MRRRKARGDPKVANGITILTGIYEADEGSDEDRIRGSKGPKPSKDQASSYDLAGYNNLDYIVHSQCGEELDQTNVRNKVQKESNSTLAALYHL